MWLLIIGFLLNAAGLVLVAIVLYSLAVLFQFITLPVEFDASRRAAVQLSNLGLTTTQETKGGVKKGRERCRPYVRRGRAGSAHAASLLRPALPRQPRVAVKEAARAAFPSP